PCVSGGGGTGRLRGGSEKAEWSQRRGLTAQAGIANYCSMQWNNWIVPSLAFFAATPLIAGELPPEPAHAASVAHTADAAKVAGAERGMWVWLHPDLENEAGHERLLAF